MNRILIVFLSAAGAALAASCFAADAGDPAAAPLHGRHVIAVRGGVFNHGRIESSVGAGGTTSRVSGFGGYVGYAYGAAPEWTLGVSIGSLDAEALSSVTPGDVVSRVASVTPVLFDARWYPLGAALGSTGRPFLGLGVGPYVGSASNSVVGTAVTNESVRETVPGARAQLGMDWILGRRFLLGLSGGYHVVGDFDQPIGGETSYSGAEFLFELGILFGAPR